MEEMNIGSQSIWGAWWLPVRKWFYTSWLAYETLFRFFEYAEVTHHFLATSGYPVLGILGGLLTFIVCTAFLTVPACFMVYHFFDKDNLTGTRAELKLKTFL